MKKNIIKTFSFMFIAMLLAKVLGLLRNIVFANFYGTGYEATAFFTASRIPLQLLDITLGAAISSTFIPVFNEYLQKRNKKEAIKFASNFLNIIILISVILSILGMIFAPTIIHIIAPDLNIEASELAIELIKILFPIMIFTSIAFVFVGILQSFDEFNIPAIISVVSNGILILYLLVFNNSFGIQGVAIAMLIGWATQMFIQLPSVLKKGFEFSFKLNFKDEGIKKVVVLAIPILISTWVQPINNIVNLRLASGLENGMAVPAIEYAYTLYLIVVGVFSYTLSNIIFPELSKLSADNEKEKFVQVMNKSVKISTYFIIPLSVAFAILSQDIVKIIYERGEFTEVSTMLTSNALMFYSIGMIGYGLMEILNKAFYAMQDAKTPMKVSVVAIVLNVIFSICLVKTIGYIGLPLAASITSIASALLLLYFINKKYNGIIDKKTFVEIIKSIIAASIMGVMVFIINKLQINIILKLILEVAIGFIAYFGITYIEKSEQMQDALKLFKKKRMDDVNE